MLVSTSLSILVDSILISVCFAAIGPVTDLHIVNSVVSPDGYPRSAVLADGIFPGPLITGRKGDNFKINVFNKLTDDTMERSVSIHWHGLFQSGTSYNDGAAMVTQCPIVPHDLYKYDFDTQDQAGTFWYHSHVATQYCDGLRGPLVIYDPEDPHAALYDVDDESTVITLADWYHKPASQVPSPFVADSTLINGHGRYLGGSAYPLAVFNVEAGKRYRFRLISMSCEPYFKFTIDGHAFTIIEVDGINVEPLLVDSVEIFAGQRYSLILEANKGVQNYWIRAEPLDSKLSDLSSGINSAILRYIGAPMADPITLRDDSVIPLVEADLHTLENPGAPGQPYIGGVDIALQFIFQFNLTTKSFFINDVSFTPPSVPVLLQILSGAMQASELLPKGSIFALPPNRVVEISIYPAIARGGPHPFHLHGHTFDVVRSAGSTKYNYVNPVRRDVVSTGFPGDNVTIRFVTDNSGPWFFHCHINFHLEAGLAIVFAEDTARTAAHNNVTHAWENLCPKYDKFHTHVLASAEGSSRRGIYRDIGRAGEEQRGIDPS